MLLPYQLFLQVMKATNVSKFRITNFHCCTIADFSLSDPTVVTFPATILSNTIQQACFSVAIIDDTVVEATEEFTLQLSTDDPQAHLTTESAVVSILDNDGEERALKAETLP